MNELCESVDNQNVGDFIKEPNVGVNCISKLFRHNSDSNIQLTRNRKKKKKKKKDCFIVVK